jgi:transcriptional regulator GlxA family with amidase domain
VRQDYGAAVANLIAREMVAAPHRAGGQAQFVSTPIVNRANGSLAAVLDWARGRLDGPLRIADLAKRAAMSERTFLRHFTSQVGIGPKQWLRRERVAAAQALLETSSKRLEVIADAAGFGSISALRQAFRDSLGISPTHYRKQFRSASKLGTATN